MLPSHRTATRMCPFGCMASYTFESSRRLTGEFHGNQHTNAGSSWYTREEVVRGVAELGCTPTTAEASDDDRLPSIATIYTLIDRWEQVLADAGLEPTQQQLNPLERPGRTALLDDLREVNAGTDGSRLTSRQYSAAGRFATRTMNDRFGSWAEACREPGIDCGPKHGTRCLGPNGERLSSRHERAVATLLDHHAIVYQVHPSVPDSNWRADFLLPEQRLWIEVDGYTTGGRPNREQFEEKLLHYETLDLDFAVVRSAEELESRLTSRCIVDWLVDCDTS